MKSITDNRDRFTRMPGGCYFVETEGRIRGLRLEFEPGKYDFFPYSYICPVRCDSTHIRIECKGNVALISGRNLEPLYFAIEEGECRAVVCSDTPNKAASSLSDEQCTVVQSIQIINLAQSKADSDD
jgi:hypothetical protein